MEMVHSTINMLACVKINLHSTVYLTTQEVAAPALDFLVYYMRLRPNLGC